MKIAIVGASGLVGRKILELLSQSKQKHEIIAYTSKKSAGKTYLNHKFIELNEQNLIKVDYALFSAGKEVSLKWAKKFTKLGAVVIDNSNAFRRNKNTPLVVPEINFNSINKKSKIIANPNCSTIQISLPLFYLNQINPIKRIIISTYQSASGAGNKGLEDLKNKTNYIFPHPLHNNLIPHIDKLLKNGFTLEEDKIMFELKKILNLPQLKITATAVRVPIPFCHGASVYVECENKINIAKIKHTFLNSKGIILQDSPQNFIYPLPLTAMDTDDVYVGRIRKDLNCPNAINFWVVADNLRKGASTNAIQILNNLIEVKNV